MDITHDFISANKDTPSDISLAQLHQEACVTLLSHKTGPDFRTGHVAETSTPTALCICIINVFREACSNSLDQDFQMITGKCSNILFCLLLKIHEEPERGQLLSVSLKYFFFLNL